MMTRANGRSAMVRILQPVGSQLAVVVDRRTDAIFVGVVQGILEVHGDEACARYAARHRRDGLPALHHDAPTVGPGVVDIPGGREVSKQVPTFLRGGSMDERPVVFPIELDAFPIEVDSRGVEYTPHAGQRTSKTLDRDELSEVTSASYESQRKHRRNAIGGSLFSIVAHSFGYCECVSPIS
jgi:hypothetical protein